MNLIINTDGASRGNPGKASYGYVIRKEGGEILHQEGKTLGIQTNNFAEYSAVLNALKYVVEHYKTKAPNNVKLVADSMLVVQQLSGRYKIKSQSLKILFDQIKILEMEVGSVIYEHTRRENNFIADRLANQALENSH